MPYIPNPDPWIAGLLAGEPAYDRAAWIDAYVMAIGDLDRSLTPDAALHAAVGAYEREGWSNPSCPTVRSPVRQAWYGARGLKPASKMRADVHVGGLLRMPH